MGSLGALQVTGADTHADVGGELENDVGPDVDAGVKRAVAA